MIFENTIDPVRFINIIQGSFGAKHIHLNDYFLVTRISLEPYGVVYIPRKKYKYGREFITIFHGSGVVEVVTFENFNDAKKYANEETDKILLEEL